MSNTAKKISTGVIVALSVLSYKLSKDIMKIGIKDGKVTKTAMAKK
jgi:hypothetical protein